jgi:glycosyltransferase 2 family protein
LQHCYLLCVSRVKIFILQKTIINILKFLAFFGIGAIILYFVYRNQNAAYQAQCAMDGIAAADCSLLQKVINDFSSVNYAWIIVVVTTFILSNWSRAVRWKMLLEPMGYRVSSANVFWAVNLGYFANLGLPRMGEMVRAATIARYEKIPLDKVLGTIVVDRLLDMVCLLIVVGLAFVLEFNTLYSFLDKNMQGGIWQNPILIAIGAIGLIGLLVTILFWKTISNLSIIQKIINLAKGFVEGLFSIKNTANPPIFLLHTINIWLMYYLMAYFCFFAFPPTANLTPLIALMVYVFGAFGVVIPSPGGMGTYHALVTAALAIYGVNSVDGFSFANIFFFSVNIFGSIAFGIAALIILPIINRKLST